MVQSVFICQYMRHLVLIIGLLTLSSGLQAQKKKNKYDLYWEEQAKKEKLEAFKDSAHQAFQSGNLDLAIKLYKEGLKVLPDDKYTNAKVQDLNILQADIEGLINKMSYKSKVNLETSMPELELVHSISSVENEELQLPLPDEEDSLQTESILEVEIDPIKPTADVKNEDLKDEIETKAKVSKEIEKQSKSIIKETAEVSETPFNIKTFRQEIAQQFPEGFTEEEYRKGRKVITRRVVVKGSLGDEYLKVRHDYGATFYFKNKQSTSINVWLRESKGEE